MPAAELEKNSSWVLAAATSGPPQSMEAARWGFSVKGGLRRKCGR